MSSHAKFDTMSINKHIVSLALCALIMGCSVQENGTEAPADVNVEAEASPAKTPIIKETSPGPVHAVVELDNEHPVLGEQVRLTLRVDSAPDVHVTMPEYADQLGSFGIADYSSSERFRDDGRFEMTQIYTLDMPMSGRLRSPSFLIEFVDNREDSEHKGSVQELLTEEFSFEVGSVFGDGEVPAELEPVLEALPELVLPEAKKSHGVWWGLLVLGLVAIGGLVFWLKHRKKEEIVLPADVVALSALDALEKEEIPSESAAVDAWYVRLSLIVRCYIEGRFELHAPRLTTEEFFELAKRSGFLKDEEKALIKKILERSDRVKFTDYVPSQEETKEMLSDARRFVMETRVELEEGDGHV